MNIYILYIRIVKALTKILNPLTLYEFVVVVSAAVVIFVVAAAAVWPNCNSCVRCVYFFFLSPQMIF